MLLTLENGLSIDLLFPEKSLYRVSNANGYYKDFETLDEAQAFVKYDFFKMVKPEIPLALDGGMNGVRSNYYKLLKKQN